VIGRAVVVLLALSALGAPAQAGGAEPALPTLALDPQVPPPSIWKGLYVGAGLSVSAAKGTKPFVGGEGYAGYNTRFDNNLVLGIQASTGFAPYLSQRNVFKGYDYAELSAKVGYEMGRLTPYVTTGIALARPNGFPGAGYASPTDSLNNVFNGSTNLAASGVFGAGFDYALTNNTTIGLAAVVGTGRGLAPPP
jgi:opacity protein-like surface antigen